MNGLRGVLSVALVGGMAAAAQSVPTPAAATPQPGFSLSVTTRIVVLDVVVTDRKGKLAPRADLTEADFTVLEDGKPQGIRSFETPAAHTMPPGDVVHSAADLKKIGDAAVTVLVLDELNSRFEDMSYSRQSMVKYLESQPAVLREPTVLMVASNTTFQQVHDYTQDRDALMQAVKKHMPEYPAKLLNGGRSGPAAVERMAQVLAALQQIAQASTGTPGRKNLIWVGNGFPTADLVGIDDVQAKTISDAFRRVTNQMLAARITMYTINPTAGSSATVDIESVDDLALEEGSGGEDPIGSGQISFSTLGPSTGGKAFQGRNDIGNEVGEGIAAGSFYYTISYSPTNESKDAARFRHVRIVMKDPSLRATTRDGYYPETATDLNPVGNAEATKDMKAKQVRANLQLDLSGALTSTISYNGLDVSARKVDAATYSITVSDATLAWNVGAGGVESGEATVAAGWYNAKGKLLGHVAREETAKRSADHAGAVFTLPVTLPPEAVRFRLLARDATTGRMGTVDVTKF